MPIEREISDPLIAGNAAAVAENVQVAYDRGEDPKVILEKGLLAGMAILGERFKKDEMFIPEVLASAKAMHAGLSILKPFLKRDEAKPLGKVVIGTVKGDVHDIGKKIVTMILEANRFEVIDIGIDVPVEKFVEAVEREKPDILALSALLTTTMPMFRETISAVQQVDHEVKTMVGGCQVTAAYAKESGADGYAPNAILAVDVAKDLSQHDNDSNRENFI